MHDADFSIEPQLEHLNRLLERVHFRPSPWLEAEIRSALMRRPTGHGPLHSSVAILLGVTGAAFLVGLFLFLLWRAILGTAP